MPRRASRCTAPGRPRAQGSGMPNVSLVLPRTSWRPPVQIVQADLQRGELQLVDARCSCTTWRARRRGTPTTPQASAAGCRGASRWPTYGSACHTQRRTVGRRGSRRRQTCGRATRCSRHTAWARRTTTPSATRRTRRPRGSPRAVRRSAIGRASLRGRERCDRSPTSQSHADGARSPSLARCTRCCRWLQPLRRSCAVLARPAA